MSVMFSDSITGVIHAALDGLSLRQRVIADNIANVDTPGYTASTVQFEGALRSAMDTGSDPTGLSPQVEATRTPAGINGNNVDLRHETMAALQTQYQYQIMARSASDHAGLITAVTGGVR